jgi:hypothetical protein
MSERSESSGAGGGSRTLVSALGRLHNGRYTTPAYAEASAGLPAFASSIFSLFVNVYLLACQTNALVMSGLPDEALAKSGAEDETRTHDLRFTKAPLYQLSYFGIVAYSNR